MIKRSLDSIQSVDFTKILVLLLCFILGLALFCQFFVYYIIIWAIIVLLYLLFAKKVKSSWLSDKLFKLSTLQLMIILFILAVILRLIFLMQKPFLSTDLEHLYLVRSQYMLDGKVPYRDFSPNKPPMYVYLLYFMGLSLGVGQIQFRIFFIAIDSLIPIVIYLIGSSIFNKRYAIVVALLYVFCPISFLEIGVAGHYDSIPAVFTMISILMLYRKKPALSGLSLGMAFAFKIYPIVIFLFFMIWFKSWKQRVKFTVAFPIPIILSFIPTLIIYPSGVIEYFLYQTIEWEPWGLVSGPLVNFFGNTFLGLKISNLILFFFLFIILVLFYTTAIKKKSYNFWLKLIILIFLFVEILGILDFFARDANKVLIAMIIIALLILLIFAYHPLSKFLDPYLSKKIPNEDNILIQSVFALMFLIIGSNQAHSWYLIWMVPFVCIIRTKDFRWFFLILLLVMHPMEYVSHPQWFDGMIYP